MTLSEIVAEMRRKGYVGVNGGCLTLSKEFQELVRLAQEQEKLNDAQG